MFGRILVATAIAAASLPAEAGCRSSNLVGAWTMSAVGFSGAGAFVGACDFVIAADGDIIGSCTAHNLEDSFRGSVAGNWKISAACQISGDFSSQEGVASDVQARMNRTKDVVTGISLDPQTINQFTAVKFEGRNPTRRRFVVPHERK